MNAQRNADHTAMERIPGHRVLAFQVSAHVTRLMDERHCKDRFNRYFNCDYTPLGYVSGSCAFTRNVCSGRTACDSSNQRNAS